MSYQSLDDWLAWQTTLHAREIELGLDRIETVARRLNLLDCPFKVITVAGTNGKGSSVAMLSAILDCAGFKVGTYTSPHILKYNERIKISLQCVDDQELCASFARIDHAREGISLSFFEFATLAALDIFHRQQVDVAILEVGLGGRLDATNMIDCDLALVTSIGLDHTEWLGDNRESIGFEKAGILREHKPAICSDKQPPQSIQQVANDKNASLYQIGQDFHYELVDQGWNFSSDDYVLTDLPMPNLEGMIQVQNAAGVIKGLHCLPELNVSEADIRAGLQKIDLDGRFQRLSKHCEVILDVAHNHDSAQNLARNLAANLNEKRTIAVFSVLSDKDVEGIAELVHPFVTDWYIAVVNSARGMNISQVKQALEAHASPQSITQFDSVATAYQQALAEATPQDRVLVFGSIFTVSEVLAFEGKNIQQV